MAVVRNCTPDTLTLFRSDAPPVDPGDSVTIRDEVFAGLAWPKSTWEVVEPPGSGYVDESTDDAHLWSPAPEKSEKSTTRGGKQS